MSLAPPAPEGWDRRLTQSTSTPSGSSPVHTVPIHYSRYLLALIVLMLLVLYTVRVQSCRTYSPCPRPRPRRVGIEDVGNNTTHTLPHPPASQVGKISTLSLLSIPSVLYTLLVTHRYELSSLSCSWHCRVGTWSRPSPPAPEGWDKDITEQHNPTTSPLYSS